MSDHPPGVQINLADAVAVLQRGRADPQASNEALAEQMHDSIASQYHHALAKLQAAYTEIRDEMAKLQDWMKNAPHPDAATPAAAEPAAEPDPISPAAAYERRTGQAFTAAFHAYNDEPGRRADHARNAPQAGDAPIRPVPQAPDVPAEPIPPTEPTPNPASKPGDPAHPAEEEQTEEHPAPLHPNADPARPAHDPAQPATDPALERAIAA